MTSTGTVPIGTDQDWRPFVRNYRAVVRATAEVVSVAAQIQAWSTEADEWTWVQIQQWDLYSSARGADLKTDLVDSFTRHGWRAHEVAHLDLRKSEATCCIEPSDWTGLLTRLLHDRDAEAARLADLERALPNAVADATDSGDLTTVRAAELVGLSRVRIYQQRNATTASMGRAIESGADIDPSRLTTSERSALGLA